MEQTTSLKGAIEEIQDLKIEVISLKILLEALKTAMELSDPRLKAAFGEAKVKLLEAIPTDTDGSRRIRDRLEQMTYSW